MKRILTALILLACAYDAQAQNVETRKYGEATTLNFSLYDITGANLKIDAVDGGTDCSIIKDEGAETAEAPCESDFVDEGSTYSIALSASEMEAARIVVCIVDGDATDAYLPKCMKVLTYGDEDAQFPDTTASDVWSNATRTITGIEQLRK